jgi:hypothetical protein
VQDPVPPPELGNVLPNNPTSSAPATGAITSALQQLRAIGFGASLNAKNVPSIGGSYNIKGW